MTDAEIIRHLAEKVMGWVVIPCSADDRREGTFPRLVEQIVLGSYWLRMHEDGPMQGRKWNPLESIADAFEVQAKVMSMPGTAGRLYVLRMHDAAFSGASFIATAKIASFMLAASPRQRCLAIVEATR